MKEVFKDEVAQIKSHDIATLVWRVLEAALSKS